MMTEENGNRRFLDSLVGALKAEEEMARIARRYDPNCDNWSKEDKARIIANTLVNPFSPYKIIHLGGMPVTWEKFSSFDPNIRTTRGIYTIKYRVGSDRKKNIHPFMISQDLLRGAYTVGEYRHLVGLAKYIPEVNWLVQYTNISQELFDVAAQHPGLGIQFTIDYPKYCKMLRRKAKELGLENYRQPLVGFKCNYLDFAEKYSSKVIGPGRSVTDLKETFKKASEEFYNGQND